MTTQATAPVTAATAAAPVAVAPEVPAIPAELLAAGFSAVEGFETSHTAGKAAEGRLTDWVKDVARECIKPEVSARTIGTFVALLRTQQVVACGTMSEEEFQAIQSVHRASVGYIKRVCATVTGFTFDINKPKRGKVLAGTDCYRVESVYEKAKGGSAGRTSTGTDKETEAATDTDTGDVTISVDPKDTEKLLRLAITGAGLGTVVFHLFRTMGVSEAAAAELTMDLPHLKASLQGAGEKRIADKSRTPAKKSGTAGK